MFSGNEKGLNAVWIGEKNEEDILFHIVLGSRVAVYNKKRDALVQEYYQFDSRGKDNRITSAILSQKKQLWLSYTKRGVLSENPYQNNFYTFPFTLKADRKNSKNNVIFEDSNGLVWIGGIGGLSVVDPKIGKKWVMNSFQGVIVECIFEDSQNRLWVGSNGRGLFRLDLDEIKGFRRNMALQKASFSSSNELPIYLNDYAFDGDYGTRWASEYSDGEWLKLDLGKIREVGQSVLYWENAFATDYEIQISPDNLRWETIHRQKEGLGGTEIIELNAKGRYLRFNFLKKNTPYGVSIYEIEVYGKQPVFVNYYVDPGNRKKFESQPKVSGIIEDHDAKIWIFGSQELMAFFDESKNSLQRVPYTEEKSYTLTSPILDKVGNIHFLSTNRRTLAKLKPDNFELSYSKPNFLDNSLNPRLSRLLQSENKQQKYLITEESGIFISDSQTETYKQYLPKTFISKKKSALCEEKEGLIWIATLHDGVYQIDLKLDSTKKHFTKKDALLSDRVYGIEKDSKGNLWFFTDRGLNQYIVELDSLTAFTTSNGLIANNLLHEGFIDS